MGQIYLHVCTRNANFFAYFLSAQLDFVNIYLGYQISPLLSYIKHINNHWNNGLSITYPFSWHWSVTAFQVGESNRRRNRLWIFPFFAGCILSFRNSPGPIFIHFFFITTVILHFTFQEVILLIYFFHCSGKSTQWPSLTEGFFWDFLAALGPHLREL